MINNYLSPAEMLNLDDVINVAVPKFFERFNSFLPKVKKRCDLRTCRSTFLNKFLQNSSELHVCEPREKRGGLFTGRISKTELNYVKIVYGKNELTPRWKHCTWEAERCCRFGTSPKPLTCLVLD
jgi:hypothetical protein